ncbi:hypothetical protein XA68_17920 [Ophiocordyceps unilateralis]|uniref:RING-type E3 ubiquitin transferase n=1 Tax=Ophiocordyceps unilateralis TaxID=268505 RepID=A0A2A9PJZ0_OPHUN|nr:hypothetical protein XA68_17920 [Ophiocordyceps unilateralis]
MFLSSQYIFHVLTEPGGFAPPRQRASRCQRQYLPRRPHTKTLLPTVCRFSRPSRLTHPPISEPTADRKYSHTTPYPFPSDTPIYHRLSNDLSRGLLAIAPVPDDSLIMAETASDHRPPDQTSHHKHGRSRPSAQSLDAAPSICRICRGEGTAAEPLFYPCKCSGSIKYVHQDCLMEWLSHSQKKYCELCKTSFRFTKLYAPDMPKSLPLHVFVEHMGRYLLRNLLTWLRAAVTISVWACWLPYFMRSVWSFMFWVSDEGLGGGSFLSRANDTDATTLWLSASVGTCPASPLLATTTTSATEAAAVLESLDGEDLSEYLLRILFGSLGMPMKLGRPDLRPHYDIANASLANGVSMPPASLLGNMNFLHNLTRSPTLNRTVVTVLEGQIITVLVIICFILVILVRDYVVQQQPEINMRAAFEEPGNDLAPEDHDMAQAAVAEPAQQAQRPDSDDEASDNVDRPAVAPASEAVPGNNDAAGAALVAHAELAGSQRDSSGHLGTDQFHNTPTPAVAVNTNGQGNSSVTDAARAHLQDSDESDIQKRIDSVYEKAVEEDFKKWDDTGRPSSNNVEEPGRQSDLARLGDPANPSTEAGPSEETDPAQSSSITAANKSSKNKGKERELTSPGPGFDLQGGPSRKRAASEGPARRRAASDGPFHQPGMNPLGSNNWSFSRLPADDPVDGDSVRTPASASAADVEASSLPKDDDLPVTSTSMDEGSHLNGTAQAQPYDDDVREPSRHRGAALEEQNPVDEAAADGQEAAGLVGRVAHFMWGDLEEPQDGIVENVAGEDADADDEDPWIDVPMAEGADENGDVDLGDVDGVVAGAGLDAEALDDLEDFEGVMELIGMRGPIAGLFQNAIFCAVLVSVTIFACIFIPYNMGRIAFWVVANPMQLVRILFEFSKVVQDAVIMLGGLSSWFVLNLLDMFTGLLGGPLAAQIVTVRKASWGLWTGAGTRVMDYALLEFPMSASEMHNFSAISHEALNTVKGSVASALGALGVCLASILTPSFYAVDRGSLVAAASAIITTLINLKAALSLVLDPGSWVIDLSRTEARAAIDPGLAYWSSLDRFWAILAGYLTIFAMGAMYLRRGTPFSRNNMVQAWEAGIIDTLHQASGIMKVIVIISIEMLVFPLYCGLLLDAALLPLFENTTIKSRILFTYNFPLTSIFVHWFVGTGYMFHFALFVSMCRKIMRPGVLYFIRDPDDPEFHPIRDVLERSLTTQLRKILFSAFVYGALVIVCLGGVVWSLSYTLPGVLPIHYSSNEPVLEFPVDLLFYNFLMPQAVKVLKPGDGLHAMYTWWFRKCARGLRLTFFLFGERRIDEEGTLQLGVDTAGSFPRHKRLFLELNEHNKVVPKSWRDTFEVGDAKPNPSLSSREERLLRRKKQHLVASGQLTRSGRFVRAPASDRVNIPKGKPVLLHVTELGRRKDGKPDNDIYASGQYQMVYIPPNFRVRIFLFILFIWLFAAVTGVGITMAPLALGRKMFKLLIPEHIRTNDIYAFSIGIYLLGTASYSVLCVQKIMAEVQAWVRKAWIEATRGHALRHAWTGLLRGAKLVYAYTFILIVFPLLSSTLMELYITIPLHTYMDPPTAEPAPKQAGEGGRHTIRVIQAWTLGLLYLNLGTRMVKSLFPESRAALAVRIMMRRGWLRPDIGILTRAFVMPGLALAAVAMFGPPLMASFLIDAEVLGNEVHGAGELAAIYRHSYPAAALVVVVVKQAAGMARVFRGWRAGIRDEAYLIGERLHNFGITAAGGGRAKRAWGAGRSRL